jgi:predicted ArsR family transcriptional regulator
MSRANGFTRQEIMAAIKVQGPMTADELASLHGISPVAVRQHVRALEGEGFIRTEVERRGLGRPVHRYSLTAEGDETFPRQYDRLAISLLDEVRSLYGDGGVEKLLVARRKREAAVLRARLAGMPTRERIAALVEAQNSTGHMARVYERGDEIVFREYNCPICRVAKGHPAACREELELFREVLEPECSVEIEETIGSGAKSCAYRIRMCGPA